MLLSGLMLILVPCVGRCDASYDPKIAKSVCSDCHHGSELVDAEEGEEEEEEEEGKEVKEVKETGWSHAEKETARVRITQEGGDMRRSVGEHAAEPGHVEKQNGLLNGLH